MTQTTEHFHEADQSRNLRKALFPATTSERGQRRRIGKDNGSKQQTNAKGGPNVAELKVRKA